MTDYKQILFPGLEFPKESFLLIAGPCAVENRAMVFEIGNRLQEICKRLNLPFVFKASYKKANRSRLDSFSGIGDEAAIEILSDLKKELSVPITSDFHSVSEIEAFAEQVDIIQIPAFLCRQTELIVAAAKTGKIVNIKKGQFLSAEAMQFAVEKVRQSGNDRVMLIERGTTFGYQDLVVDFRSIPQMQSFKVPVILDCTHSLQQPNQASGVTGGKPALIETIAKAGIAVGVNGLFIETHPNPAVAKSDGANMLALDKVQGLLERLIRIRKAII